MNSNQKHWLRMMSDILSMTTSIVASIFIGLWGGQWLDKKFPLPWFNGVFFTIICFLLGVITAGRIFWTRGLKAFDDNNLNNKQDIDDENDRP